MNGIGVVRMHARAARLKSHPSPAIPPRIGMAKPPCTPRELVDRLDARHDELITKLDELNAQIEAALVEFNRSREAAAAEPPVRKAA